MPPNVMNNVIKALTRNKGRGKQIIFELCQQVEDATFSDDENT